MRPLDKLTQRFIQFYIQETAQLRDIFKIDNPKAVVRFDRQSGDILETYKILHEQGTKDKKLALEAMELSFRMTPFLHLRFSPQEERRHYQLSLKLSQQFSDKTMEQRFLYEIGTTYADEGEFQSALPLFEDAIKLKNESSDLLTLGHIYRSAGINYSAIGKNDKAKEALNAALEIATELNDDYLRNLVLGNLGRLHRDAGEYQQAMEKQLEALQICRRLKHQYNEAITLGQIGLLYYFMGNPEASIEHCEQAYAIFLSLGNKRNIGNTIGLMGNAYYSISQYSQAAKCFQEAYNYALVDGDRMNIANWTGALGMVLGISERYDEGIASLEKSISISRAINYQVGLGNGLYYLANTLIRKKDFATAKALVNEGRKLAEAIDFYQGKVGFAVQSGILLMQEEDLIGAIKQFDLALDLLKKTDDKAGISEVTHYLGQIDIRQKSIDSGLNKLWEAKNLAESIPQPHQIADILLTIAKVHLAENDIQKACEYIQEAYQLYKQLEVPISLKEAEDLLGANC